MKLNIYVPRNKEDSNYRKTKEIMILNVYCPRGNSDSKAWQVFSPFQVGWDDDTYVEQDYEYQGGRGMFWGFVGQNESMIRQYQNNGLPWYFSDMPYFGRWHGLKEAINPDKEFYWRIIENQCHTNMIQKEYPSDRFDKHGIELKPRNENGSEILLCPSSETMTRFHHNVSVQTWLETVTYELRKHTDRPIRIRHKPRGKGTSGPAAALIPFEEDIKNCWAVVTSVSMAGVEAVLNGVPAYCTHQSSPNIPLSNWAMEANFIKIEYPHWDESHIQRWVNWLSYNQFTPKEMASGEAREILSDIYS